MNKVVHLAQPTLADIPRVLRSVVDEIEAGTYGTVVAGIISLECADGILQIFGAGATDRYRALALITGTQQVLSQRIYGVSTDLD